MDEQLIVVDHEDNFLRAAPRDEVRRDVLRHRAVAILLFDTEGNIFVHQRSSEKDIFPSYYDVCIGGCVRQDEDIDVAARRELKEEAGIDAEPQYLFGIDYESDDNRNYAHVYKVTSSQTVSFDDGEIVWGKFMPMEEAEKMMEEKDFCADTVIIYKRFKDEEL